MGLNTQTENKFTGARNAGFSFSCFTAQRSFVIYRFMMFVQHRHPVCSRKHISSGTWELLSLLAQNWISRKIKQKDRKSIFHAWALQGGKAGSRNYISRFPWDTAAPCAVEEMEPCLLPLLLEEENSEMAQREKPLSAITWSSHRCCSSVPQV